MWTRIARWSTAIGLGLVLVASAQENPANKKPKPAKHEAKAKENARPKRQADPFFEPRVWDTNHDGYIDDAEITAAMPKLAQNAKDLSAKLIKTFDTDGDGSLNEAETAHMNEVAALLRQASELERVNKGTAMVTTDAQVQQLEDNVRAAITANNKHMLDKYDTNHDGVLSADELQAAKADHGKGRPEKKKKEQ